MKTGEWFESAVAEAPGYREAIASTLLSRRKKPASLEQEGPGHVVEFLKGGKHKCGVLLTKKAHLRHLHRILDMDDKENFLHSSKIIDISSAFIGTRLPRHEIVNSLREIDRDRDRLKTTINVNELWEVVQPEGEEWSLEDLANLYFAQDPGRHGTAALFRALEDHSIFERHGKIFVPLQPDEVAERRATDEHAAQADLFFHHAARWLRDAAKGEGRVPPQEADRAVALLAAKVLFGTQHRHAEQANELARLAHFHTREAIFNALVRIGHWKADENLDLIRHDIPTEFEQGVFTEAGGAQRSQPRRRVPRLWLRRVYSFSGPNGRHERAISIRHGLFGFTVGLHLASPAFLLHGEGLIQQAAKDRGTGLHLPDRFIPMLPGPICEKAALSENELNPTLSVQLRFDSDFNLKKYCFEIRRGRVTSPVTVEEANTSAEKDPGLRRLLNLARHLRGKRVAAGAIIVDEPRVEARVKHDEIRLRRTDPNSPALLIEQEFSILANTLAGQWFKEKGLPAIYRTEDPPAEVFVGARGFDPVAAHHQKKVMPKAILQTQPGAHHGLGSEAYAPITRPFMRYTDLLMHEQLVGFLEGVGVVFSDADLREALFRTASARMTARKIERASNRYWILRYLESRIGAALDAVVLERIGNGCLVELNETRMSGNCPGGVGTILEPGDGVQVRLVKVSARADVLRLQLIEKVKG